MRPKAGIILYRWQESKNGRRIYHDQKRVRRSGGTYLNYLQTEKRKEITERIKVARSFGDLSENAEYAAARDEQTQNELEITELENKIDNARIMEESTDHSRVHFGSTVTVFDCDLGEKATYTIKGATEVDLDKGVISIESPVGAALLGAQVGRQSDRARPQQFRI